jgi:hypothetical protein
MITARIRLSMKNDPSTTIKQQNMTAMNGMSASIKLYMIELHPSVVRMLNTVRMAFPIWSKV